MSVKTSAFLKHLRIHGCELYRNGGKHDVWMNLSTRKRTTVPRHPQIDKKLSEMICKQLQIPKI